MQVVDDPVFRPWQIKSQAEMAERARAVERYGLLQHARRQVVGVGLFIRVGTELIFHRVAWQARPFQLTHYSPLRPVLRGFDGHSIAFNRFLLAISHARIEAHGPRRQALRAAPVVAQPCAGAPEHLIGIRAAVDCPLRLAARQPAFGRAGNQQCRFAAVNDAIGDEVSRKVIVGRRRGKSPSVQGQVDKRATGSFNFFKRRAKEFRLSAGILPNASGEL